MRAGPIVAHLELYATIDPTTRHAYSAAPVRGPIPCRIAFSTSGCNTNDHAYTRQLRKLMETATWWMDSMFKSGIPRDSAQKILNLEDLRGTFVHGNDAEATALWEDIIKGQLPERVGKCVVGYHC